ncbi:O-antigen ligase family protein [Sphingomonas sp. Leaf42]|uniref:O-antigen ligase family protein n=2 Tax=unclassified Sphingomonas TaxID=196159 RepID=UPI001F288C1C|nr:O-antigen ligase family protein [Sphingomonas sp. Leaf42]
MKPIAGRRGLSPSRTGQGGTAADPVDHTAGIVPVVLFVAALVVLAMGGGSNRTDVASLLYVRPLLVLLLGGMLLFVEKAALRSLRVPLLLFALALAVGIVQLIPLPPAIWQTLPERSLFVEAAAAQGLPQPWRPLSLTPDLTLQALLWFTAPACALAGWAAIPRNRRIQVFVAILILCMTSAVFGALQASQGADSPLYLYQRTYEGNAVGFLANRNHQGALLAIGFPLLRVWTLLPAKTLQFARARLIMAAIGAVALIPMILLTASRAGLALGGLGIVLAAIIAPWRDIRELTGTAGRYVPLLFAAAGIALAGLIVFFGRALAFDRFLALSATDDLRVRFTPQVLSIIKAYLPFGSGLGSFDPVFRIFETEDMLRPTTYNHAHNDFFEIAMTSGVAGIALVAAGIAWWAWSGWQVFRDRSRLGIGMMLGRAGWSVMLILMLASIVDYPLRTPLLGFVFALSAAWLASAGYRPAGGVALQHGAPPVDEVGQAGSLQEFNH